MRKSTKLKCCSITSLVIGTVLVIIGVAWNWIMNSLVIMGAKQGAAMTAANSKMWKGIPGNFDIVLARKTHVYSCINHDDVIYKGEKPIMEEWGPYYYREYDDYDEPNYG